MSSRRGMRGTPVERFWRKVRQTEGGCWEWTAARTPRGYGNFALCPEKHVMSHRFSYEVHYGPIPKGLVVCHTCDNPPCCNPSHLFAATQFENLQDAKRKGRTKGPLKRKKVA